MAIQKVNEFKEFSFSYQSNGNCTLQFYTDMPGGALAARLGGGVVVPTSSSARVTYTVPLDGIEGTEFYFKFTPASAVQFRLFSGHVKLRLIGVYLDGSTLPQAEIYQSQVIAVGA